MSKFAVKRWAKLLLFLLCLALLGGMVWKAGPAQLWQTLCTLPLAILSSVIVWGVGYLINAASFREVLAGVAPQIAVPRFLDVFRLTVSGYAINYITPFGLLGGEPYRVLALRKHYGSEGATQGVVLYSMMHIASHFCFWLLSALVLVGMIWCRKIEGAMRLTEICSAMALMLICLALLTLFWRLYRRGIMLRFMRRWVDWPLLNPSLLPPRRFSRALGWELLSRLVNVIEYVIIMQALGFATFGYIEALLVVAFSSLLANILFFSPLQMGTREGGILLALQYLLPGELLPVALTLSFATRIREFIWIAIGLLLSRRSAL